LIKQVQFSKDDPTQDIAVLWGGRVQVSVLALIRYLANSGGNAHVRILVASLPPAGRTESILSGSVLGMDQLHAAGRTLGGEQVPLGYPALGNRVFVHEPTLQFLCSFAVTRNCYFDQFFSLHFLTPSSGYQLTTRTGGLMVFPLLLFCVGACDVCEHDAGKIKELFAHKSVVEKIGGRLYVLLPPLRLEDSPPPLRQGRKNTIISFTTLPRISLWYAHKLSRNVFRHLIFHKCGFTFLGYIVKVLFLKEISVRQIDLMSRLSF